MSKCPYKGKRRFPNRREAEAALTTIWRHGWKRPGPMPCRAYECKCGRWHLTSEDRHHRHEMPVEVLSNSHQPG